MAKLIFRYGAMGSSKTANLLHKRSWFVVWYYWRCFGEKEIAG